MASIEVITFNGVNHNVYGTLQQTNQYLAVATNTTAWDAASQTRKQQLKISAHRMLERAVWQGELTDAVTPQADQWPRTGLVDKNGVDIGTTEIPQELCDAESELANWLANEAATAASIQDKPNTGTNLKSDRLKQKVGDLETDTKQEYFQPTQNGGAGVGRFPQRVMELIGLWLQAGQDVVGNTATGTACKSMYSGRNLGFFDPGLP